MRLSITLLGREVFAVEFGTPAADDEQPYDTGYTTSMPAGFVRPEIPWDVDGSYHQFDPEPDGENP